jgi:hypothetical protein
VIGIGGGSGKGLAVRRGPCACDRSGNNLSDRGRRVMESLEHNVEALRIIQAFA